MKKMRRVLALLLVLVMAAYLLACGTKKTEETKDIFSYLRILLTHLCS